MDLNTDSLSHKTDKISFTRQRLFSGFDGKMCKIVPTIATDGNIVLMTWQKLLLSGSDVVYGELMAKSTDGGKTFSPGVEQEVLQYTWEGSIRTAYSAFLFYSRTNKRWFGLGAAQRFENDKVPMLWSKDGKPATWPMFYTVDPEAGAFTSKRYLPVPFEFERAIPFGQIVECDNGELLVPFYVIPPENRKNQKSYSIVTRCRFEGDEFKVIEAGTPISNDDYPRGMGEPSLAKLGDKYYITLRTDIQGLWAESDDGMTFSEPKPWRWDDGSILENYNTQQHWMRPDGALYLAYTRKGAHNDHVFRHRAPIFMAKFDPERGCLIRSTEVILVPELGARLGNFNAIEVSPTECWLTTAEWMQSWDAKPETCAKYGSDNSLWIARVSFEIAKPLPPFERKTKGALCLTFDDRHFTSWIRELPCFRKYGARATFFICGEFNQHALDAIKVLRADGHSIAFHGVTHAKAPDLMETLGPEKFLEVEILPQIEAAKAAGIPIKTWSYPMSRRNEATDAVLGKYFKRLRTGYLWRTNISEDRIKDHDELFMSAEEAPSARNILSTPIPSVFDECLADIEGVIRRVRERDEVVVLYAHNIRNDGVKDSHDISSEQLEAILEMAYSLGVPVIGLDELS